MKERPILFSGEMVRAILDGRKTMTRRIVKPQPAENYIPLGSGYVGANRYWTTFDDPSNDDAVLMTAHCPYGKLGDRLWVRETWADVTKAFQSYDCEDIQNVAFRADGSVYVAGGAYLEKLGDSGIFVKKWKPSIFLPRYASRITLEITNIRVERLQDISEADAKAEGALERPAHGKIVGDLGRAGHWQFRQGFRELWDSINGKRASWELNPWVWVVEFQKI